VTPNYPSSQSGAPVPRANAVNAGELLDNGRLTGYLLFLIFLTALTVVFDGANNQLLGIAIPSLMRDWSLPRGAFAPLLAIGMVGMIGGGALGGLLGDRFGRKTILISCVVLFGAATLATAAVNTVSALGTLRFVAGLGFGGAMPNAAALAAEYVPRRVRPITVSLTIVSVPIGGMLAAFVGSRILPTHGWRTLFVIGGLAPLLTAALITPLLVESPRLLVRQRALWPKLRQFIARAGHQIAPDAAFDDPVDSAQRKVTLGAVLVPEFRRDTAGLWCAFFSCLLAVYAGFSWIPSLLSGAGLSISVASSGLLYFNLGGVVGAVAGALAISRFGSKVTMLSLSAGAVASALVLSAMTISGAVASGPILAMLTLSGALINAVQTTMYALATHVYPAAMRATGVGAAASIGRVGGLASTFVGAWALERDGSRAYFAVIAATMTLTFVGLAVMRRHVSPMDSRRKSQKFIDSN